MTTEAKVGAFVLCCLSLLAFTLIYIISVKFNTGAVPYRTYLRYAGGLEPGAMVLWGGINAGKITAVRPWSADPTQIEILLEVKEGTPLNEKSVAKLGYVSLMNSAALSISTGNNDAKRLAPGASIPSQEVASLDEIAGKLTAVSESADGLIKQAQGELLGISSDAHVLLGNLNAMTGKSNQQKIQATLDHAHRLLETEGPKIDRLSDQLLDLSRHADNTIQNANGTISDVHVPLQRDLAEVQDTLQQTKKLLTSLQGIVQANDDNIDEVVENLRATSENLILLSDSLKQRPWSLVRIKQPKQRSVPK